MASAYRPHLLIAASTVGDSATYWGWSVVAQVLNLKPLVLCWSKLDMGVMMFTDTTIVLQIFLPSVHTKTKLCL